MINNINENIVNNNEEPVKETVIETKKIIKEEE